MISSETKDWIRNPADERAALAGMVFDGERAAFACDWIESYCCLYEGRRAGELIELMPYQRDYLSRLFGWVKPSREWGGWIRRFTHGALWAAKKNGKSPLCAAVNLYLLIADGEAGNKIYQGASDGKQAAIAQRHAIEMVRQSPALKADCKIHGTTSSIHHRPSNSDLVILTGNDSRGFEAKEGLNGSVSFDEMHVVSREMYGRTERAGRSRREPLILSWSTAGDDVDSAGHDRWQYGRQVNSGERNDLQFLHVEYSAPECTEAEIEVRLDDVCKAANPAWDVLVKPSVLRQDWEQSKHSNYRLAQFRQYTLNQWVGSSNRWLDKGGWEKGKRSYSIADLAGRECVLSIDLSRTRDMTGAVFSFAMPEVSPETIRVWPMFWLPEERAKELHHRYPYLDWAAKGWLKLTKGATVDYNQVKDDIRETVNKHHLIVLSLYYDKHLANELTQALHEGETIDGHAVPGVVAERIEFVQHMVYYSAPSKEFERRVISGHIEHPDNGVLDWMAEHCEVETDKNQNIRPVKPNKDSAKSIDGIQCCVMNMAHFDGSKRGTEFLESYFDWPGFWFEQWPKLLLRRLIVLTRGKEAQAHIVAGVAPGGVIYLDAEIQREDTARTVERAFDLAKGWQPLESITVEDVPFWNEIVPTIQATAHKRKVRLPPWNCLHGTSTDRAERIRRATMALKERKIRVRATRGGRELVRQWTAWPSPRDEAAEAVGSMLEWIRVAR